jgi:hypothetical protein
MRFTLFVAVAALVAAVVATPLDAREPKCFIDPCLCHGQQGCCC